MSTSWWGPELLPSKGAFGAGEEVALELRGLPASVSVTLWCEGSAVAQALAEDGWVHVAGLPDGRYGAEASDASGVLARTAFAIGAHEMRYGFVVDYRPGRDVAEVVDFARRLHLTDIQFYDWAYRHADLNGGGELYADALGQPVSLDTVRALVDGLASAGARSLGYAAVYGVGDAELEVWADQVLRQADGLPWGLGDFLTIVDPSDATWLEHFTAELQEATERLGFAGFHLDQYGYPKRARRSDGTMVDLAEAFAAMIETVRAALPEARLVFNQVNDFPTWRTGGSPQDAVYVEVWPPHTTLADLGRLTTASRRHGKPVVISAYLKPYEADDQDAADAAARLTMATVFSHGGSHLLVGEADRVLTDPYYVRNHQIRPETGAMLRRWYDFLVEHGDYLTDPGLVEVTGAYADAYNGDLEVTFSGTEVSWNPEPGTVWRRITRRGDDLIVHLINLVGQDDAEWDAPKKPAAEVTGGVLWVRPASAAGCRVLVADPDGAGRLVELPVRAVDGLLEADLPSLHSWQLIVVKENNAN